MVYRHLPADQIVGVYDNNLEKLNDLAKSASLEKVLTAKFIILAIPISAIESVCSEIAPFLKAGQVVIDTCSVKEYPIRCMLAQLPLEVEILGTHPLFGPDSGGSAIAGLKIAVCPARVSPATYDCIRSFLHRLNLVVIEASPQEHDLRIAQTQAIFHLIAQALKRLEWGVQEVSTPGPTTFYSLVESVQHDTDQLFLDLERRNGYARECRQQFIRKVIEMDELIAAETLPD